LLGARHLLILLAGLRCDGETIQKTIYLVFICHKNPTFQSHFWRLHTWSVAPLICLRGNFFFCNVGTMPLEMYETNYKTNYSLFFVLKVEHSWFHRFEVWKTGSV
jgi:hypothetical protein